MIRQNASGRMGRSSHQKPLCCIRRLSNGLSFEQLDDMSRMSTKSLRFYFQNFAFAVVGRFGGVFITVHNCS